MAQKLQLGNSSEESTLDQVWYVAQKLVAAKMKNPLDMLEQTLQTLCDYHEYDQSEADLTIQRLLEIPMGMHKNILNSYVMLWAKQNGVKTELDETYEKLEEHKLKSSDQDLLNVLKNALSDIQDSVDEGYRTPLILLNELYVKRNNLDALSKQAIDEILSPSSKDLCVLSGAWIKQVASWQI